MYWLRFGLFILYLCFTACISYDVTNVKYKEHRVEKRQAKDNVTEDPIFDNHDYYTSKIMSDPNGDYWNELEGHTKHTLSNDKHLRYSFISISFKFPYYGHKIDRFALTTQGYLYMSEFTHPDLNWTFTHYLAPLMGNFHTFGEDSQILYKDDGKSFVVEWRNVELNDQPEKGNFTFQTTLFENGTILFGYKTIPTTDIDGTNWPVIIGISDAYYYDVNFIGYVTRYIIRYHVVNFNVTDIANNTVIVLDLLPTCNQASTCEECTKLDIGFDCSWCSAVSRCSDGLDWHRQEWVENNCLADAFNKTAMCPVTTSTVQPQSTTPKPTTPTPKPTTTTPTPKPTVSSTITSTPTTKTTSPTTSSSTPKPTTTSTKIAQPPQSSTSTLVTTVSSSTRNPSVITEAERNKTPRSKKDNKSTVVVVVIVVILVVLLSFVGVWIIYARTHPNTKSGIWLIEHSPRRIKQMLSEIKFSKDSQSDGNVTMNSNYKGFQEDRDVGEIQLKF